MAEPLSYKLRIQVETIKSQCGRSVFQVLVVRVDTGVVTYKAMTAQCGGVSGSGPGCRSGYRSSDLCSYDTPVCEVSGLGPGCHSVYSSGDQ